MTKTTLEYSEKRAQDDAIRNAPPPKPIPNFTVEVKFDNRTKPVFLSTRRLAEGFTLYVSQRDGERVVRTALEVHGWMEQGELKLEALAIRPVGHLFTSGWRR